MRNPSTASQLYAWHQAAVSGARVQLHDGSPHCGWYKRKLVKGGPWVPVKIICKQTICNVSGELLCDEQLVMEVEGIDRGDPSDDWTYLTPISKQDYERLMDRRLRDSRMIDSTSKIDLSSAPTLPSGVVL